MKSNSKDAMWTHYETQHALKSLTFGGEIILH